MTNMSETSLFAYHSFDPADLERKEKLVIAAFNGDKTLHMTRANLCAATGLPINSICGRVRSLLDKGWLKVDGTVIAPGTNKPHELLVLA
jgi:hypothetical protein